MKTSDMVEEFHAAFGQPVRTAPAIPDRAETAFRVGLLDEEFNEYLEAVHNGDIVETADALADMVYVINGTAHVYGIDLDAVLAEVHRSNMSKLGADGKPIYRSDGKVLKGPEFFPPDIAGVLGVESV